jgi:hypothetical protein
MPVHPSQIANGSDVIVHYSPDGGLSWLPFTDFYSYGFSLDWSIKEHIPAPNTHTEAVKLSRKVKLSLARLEDRESSANLILPSPCWIKISIRLAQLPSGAIWYWARKGKFTILGEREESGAGKEAIRSYDLSSSGVIDTAREVIIEALELGDMASVPGDISQMIFVYDSPALANNYSEFVDQGLIAPIPTYLFTYSAPVLTNQIN